jgi:N-acyl-phosphatidylethanolamine-hydrolysing phospholipase D
VSTAPAPRAPHHLPAGGFRNPWPVEGADRGSLAFFRWRIERMRQGAPGRPASDLFPVVPSRPALPRAGPGEVRITWVGHSTFLLQIGTANILTDPVWSLRASPVQWAGPTRLAPPGLRFAGLPPIDAVLLSHDHFDHLDRPTARRLHERFGDALSWIAPLGHARWLSTLDISRVIELDWWHSAHLDGGGTALEIVALPAQHWTRRSLLFASDRLWASFAIVADGARLYFAGDSGYFSGYRDIGERYGPFDVSFFPIGAYEPRWFMRPAHMNPEEAVRAYQDLGGYGDFVGMHWGTFQLSDEPPLEPPHRVRAAWAAAGLPPDRLWVPRHGETRSLARAESAEPERG